jgi:hypothetical protein
MYLPEAGGRRDSPPHLSLSVQSLVTDPAASERVDLTRGTIIIHFFSLSKALCLCHMVR